LEVAVKSKRSYLAMSALCVGFLFLGTIEAQEVATDRHVGVVQDWSDRSIVFTYDGLQEHPELLNVEPRITRKLAQRQARASTAFSHQGDAPQLGGHRDWSFSLGGGHVATNMYPAKYSFDPSQAPSCQNDFVVFGLNRGGAKGGQANMVGLNNLYSGPGGLCGASPTVLFAYDVTTGNGKVATSPVLSEDGTKIAFVESQGAASIFHVLTWTAGQGTSVTAAVVPTTMTSLTYSSFSTTSSAPWIDYSDDIAYVGDDNGTIYEISPVFTGTPALVRSIPVSTGYRMSPPVLDREIGQLLVGSRNGDLYEIDTATGNLSALIVGAHGGTNPGVLAPPIIDITSGTAFVTSSNDGTSAVLVQVDVSTLTQLEKARIGIGAHSKTVVSIGQPALDNNYYNDPSTGTIYVCGTGANDTTPWLYTFGFSGIDLNTSPTTQQQLLTSTAAACTNFTEFFNVNLGTDFFFFGLTQDCTGTGTSGCVLALTSSSLLSAPVAGGPSGIVIDNYSSQPQASSIYLTGEKVNSAFKFTQQALQ
jgi:hypothetical protein